MNIGKAFAFLMELAWHPLLVYEAFHEPKIAVISACNEEYAVKDFFMNSVSCIPNSTHFHLSIKIPQELARQGFGFQKPSWYHERSQYTRMLPRTSWSILEKGYLEHHQGENYNSICPENTNQKWFRVA
uniref:Uncharacterized protein n=1 Tax=viral metagenome TaxID=1070528 RepID=A0A6C0J058_9ZZZZ